MRNRETKTGRQDIDSKPIRLAVAGAGLIGKRHIDAITQSPGVSLAGVVDPASAAAAYAASLGAARYEGISEMLAGDRPDGVIVATPNQLHVEHGLACIAAGIPVLIEKPISSDVLSAERLVLAAFQCSDHQIRIAATESTAHHVANHATRIYRHVRAQHERVETVWGPYVLAAVIAQVGAELLFHRVGNRQKEIRV